jgi:hypothetical protein
MLKTKKVPSTSLNAFNGTFEPSSSSDEQALASWSVPIPVPHFDRLSHMPTGL